MDKSEVSDTHSLKFEDADSALDFAEREWINASKCPPMRIMVAGLGGTGKSTLINRLFGPGVNEGCRGKATTECHKHKLKNDVEAIIFETAVFDDPDIDEHRIVAEMKLKTEGKLDLLLYCLSIASSYARVTRGDVRAICLLTNVFDPPLWNNAIFVLTFANVACTGWVKTQDQYEQLIETIDKELRKQLKDKARVPEDIVSKIPVVAAGYMKPVNEPHEQMNWEEKLFRKLLERNPETSTALLKAKMSNKEQFIAIVAGAFLAGGIAGSGGAGAGAGVVAGVGALVGALGGPFGAAGGAAVGSVVGAGTFGILGLVGSAGTLMLERNKFKDRAATIEDMYSESHTPHQSDVSKDWKSYNNSC